METRIFLIELLLGLSSLIGTASWAVGQDKPRPETKAPAPKSADHATTGDENATGQASDSASNQAVIWPGMTRAGAVVLPNGWSLKPAGRQSKLGDLPVQIALHPTDPILAILHAGYGEHEVVTVNASTGKVIGRVALPTSFAGLVWSADGKRLFAGGGFDDRIYRFDHAEGLLFKKTVFDYPDRKEFLARAESSRGREGQEISTRTGGAGAHQGWQDTIRRRRVRPFRRAIRRRIGSLSGRDSARARQLSHTAWRSTSRGNSSMSASGARPRWPSSTRAPSRSLATGRPRTIPTRCCWQRAARSCLSPTPTATP